MNPMRSVVVGLEGTLAPAKVVFGCGIGMTVVFGTWRAALWSALPTEFERRLLPANEPAYFGPVVLR